MKITVSSLASTLKLNLEQCETFYFIVIQIIRNSCDRSYFIVTRKKNLKNLEFLFGFAK